MVSWHIWVEELMRWSVSFFLLYSDHHQSYCFFNLSQIYVTAWNPYLWYLFSRLSKILYRVYYIGKPYIISLRIWTESYQYFPVYEQNLQYTEKYGYNSVHIRENTDQRKVIFWHISPSAYRNNFSSVYFNLTLNWIMYIRIVYFDLVYFTSMYAIYTLFL